ncbi:Circumsporozoite protein, partial [Trachymyrmex cornetzi]
EIYRIAVYWKILLIDSAWLYASEMCARKLGKQVDRLQIQLSDEKSRNRELSAQLTEAADYKPSIRYFNSFFDIFCEQIAALERSRKIEELQKRLVESEMLRTRYNRKLTMAKEQMRTTAETADQERSINDHSLQLLRDEMAQVKQNLSEVTRRESQKLSRYFSVIHRYSVASLKHFDLLQSFRVSVAKLLSEPICTPDYEIISRLQKMVAAHRDFTMLSRRYDEPLETSPSRCTSIHPVHPPRSPGSRCTRYEDSGFADPPDLHDIDDDYNKRPVRSSLLPALKCYQCISLENGNCAKGRLSDEMIMECTLPTTPPTTITTSKTTTTTGSTPTPTTTGSTPTPTTTGSTPTPTGTGSTPPPTATGRTPPPTATGRTPPPTATGRTPPPTATGRTPPPTATGRTPPPTATGRTPPPTATGRTPPPTATGRTPPPTATGRTPPPTATGRTPPPTATGRTPPPTATGRTPPPTATGRTPPPTATGRTPPPTATGRTPPPTATGRTPPPTVVMNRRHSRLRRSILPYIQQNTYAEEWSCAIIKHCKYYMFRYFIHYVYFFCMAIKNNNS